MTKLSTNEFISDGMLMTMISAHKPMEERLVDKLLATVSERLKKESGGTPNDKVYDVRVSVNGIELDFAEYTKHVHSQLEDMVTRAAGEMIKESIGDTLSTLTDKLREDLDVLSDAVREKACKLLNYNPWENR